MNLLGNVETRGIEPVPIGERRGRALGLFGVWFAANVGILSFVFGAILASFGLDLVQAVAVTLVATVASFLLVGAVSVAGTWSGMPALTLSRRALGRVGNLGPAAVSWVSVLGWEAVASVIAAWALLGLGHVAFGISAGPVADVVALGAVVVASLVLGLVGHQAIMGFQRAATLVFGALSVVLVPLLLVHTHWSAVAGRGAAPLGSVLAAGSILAAGTGVSWVNLAPDYSRYLPVRERPAAIAAWVTLGAALPTVVLVLTGYALATRLPALATSLDPVGPVGTLLPSWFSVPYLLAAAGGMLAETDLSCYSSGLTLLALGVRIRRSRTVVVDAAVVAVAGLWMMLGRQGFLAPFESFLELLAAGLAAWAGVVLADLWRARRRRPGSDVADHYATWQAFDAVGVAAWAAGTTVALLTTVSPFFTGSLARGFLAQGSFGFALGLPLALMVAGAGWAVQGRRRSRRTGGRVPSTAGRGPERLVVVGSVIVEVIVHVGERPARGDVLAHAQRMASGGGFNVLAAAVRRGLSGAYLGRIGDGPFGRQVTQDLAASGISALLPGVTGADSGFTIGVVESDGDPTFITSPGIESRLEASDLECGARRLRSTDALYVSGYDLAYPVSGPALTAWLRDRSAQHLVVMDPGPRAPRIARNQVLAVLPAVGLVSANADEAHLLTGCPEPERAAVSLASRLAPGGLAVVRDGASGCWLARNGEAAALLVPGYEAAVLDTTGAGDVHVGTMVARLAAGDEPGEAARVANLAAAVSIERLGGAMAPSPADLEEAERTRQVRHAPSELQP